jgi:hypothetical protein
MPSLYNRVAGQSVDRLAMTLLVLDLRVPAREAIHTEQISGKRTWRSPHAC